MKNYLFLVLLALFAGSVKAGNPLNGGHDDDVPGWGNGDRSGSRRAWCAVPIACCASCINSCFEFFYREEIRRGRELGMRPTLPMTEEGWDIIETPPVAPSDSSLETLTDKIVTE